MSGRVLVVGQAESRTSDRAFPFSSGTCSRTLWRWLGCRSYGDFLGRAHAVNAGLRRGGVGKGDGFRRNDRQRRRILREIEAFDLVILVGREAQKIVHPTATSSMVWRRGKFAGVPHPSGINLQLNWGGSARVGRWVRKQLLSLA